METTWQLELSITKCCSLLLKGYSLFEDECDLIVDDKPLSVIDNVKDLGVIVDNHLSFDNHVSSIISKAKQRIFLIFKSFESRYSALLVCAFKT